MDEFRDNRLAFYWHEGILMCDWLVEEADFDLVEFGIKIRREMTGNKKIVMLSDMRKLKYVSREGRQRMAAKDAGEGVLAVAIVINSKVQATLYNFFSFIYKEPSPAKLFTNKEEAIKWCKNILNENI
ncbi:MAG: hypothetical protein Fur0028_14430 [Bacteroidales bacterium]